MVLDRFATNLVGCPVVLGMYDMRYLRAYPPLADFDLQGRVIASAKHLVCLLT